MSPIFKCHCVSILDCLCSRRVSQASPPVLWRGNVQEVTEEVSKATCWLQYPPRTHILFQWGPEAQREQDGRERAMQRGGKVTEKEVGDAQIEMKTGEEGKHSERQEKE